MTNDSAQGSRCRPLVEARQERLAPLAGLDRTYVSGIERGERNPSLTNLLKIAAALNVHLSELARDAERLVVVGQVAAPTGSTCRACGATPSASERVLAGGVYVRWVDAATVAVLDAVP